MFYAVKKGYNIGIYNSWPECQQQIQGYKGSIFKKFNTNQDAVNFISTEIPDQDSIIYIDGGFNRTTGDDAWGSVVNGFGFDLIPYSSFLLNDMELKEVDLPKGKRTIIVANFNGVKHQNNGAELLSLVAGLRLAIYLINNNIPVKTIYSDSQVVLYWSIRLKEESAVNFDQRKVTYIRELIELRREFEKLGGKIEKVDGGSNPADLGYH